MKKRMMTIGIVIAALAAGASARADSLLEKIATAVLADQFGIDTREVIALHQRTGVPVYDLAPIYEAAHYGRTSPTTIWDLRRQGLGWGQVAQRINMHPGTFNKLRNAGAFDRDRFWARTYRDRFGVTDQQVTVLRREGGSLEDVLGAIIVGKLTNRDPQTIYDSFRTEQSWNRVTTNYNVKFENWRRVSKPVKTVLSIPKNAVVKGNSAAAKSKAGKGTTKAKGAGNGKGNTKAKGSGNGKGKGKGRGG